MPAQFQQRFNVAPTQAAPIVRRGRDGALVCRDHRWGLVPFWTDDPSIGNRLINARSESAARKPAFKDAFIRRRCIVPSTGFYEWKQIGNVKQPFLVSRRDNEPYVYAGLWERWKQSDADRDDPPLLTYTILTCTPSASIAALHDRMPAMLTDEDTIHAWLDPEQHDVDALQKLLKSAPDDLLEVHPVSRRVNKPENDDPSLIEPIPVTQLPGDSPPEDEPTLFG